MHTHVIEFTLKSASSIYAHTMRIIQLVGLECVLHILRNREFHQSGRQCICLVCFFFVCVQKPWHCVMIVLNGMCTTHIAYTFCSCTSVMIDGDSYLLVLFPKLKRKSGIKKMLTNRDDASTFRFSCSLHNSVTHFYV